MDTELVKDGELAIKSGQFITIKGVTYLVGQILDYRKAWHVRLDRKFEASIWMDIDKEQDNASDV